MTDLADTVAEMPKRSLLPGVLRGEEEAAHDLFRAHGDSVLRYVYRRVAENAEDAEEVTIDTFVSAVKLAETFEPGSSVFAWLCGIAKLRIVDFYRKKDRLKRVPAEKTRELNDLVAGAITLDQTLERIEASRVVDALMECLNEEEREAVLLRYADGLSTREAAKILNRSERGVESLLTRAKAKAKSHAAKWRMEERP